MSIKPSNLYSIDKWKNLIETQDCSVSIDTCLKTICYNYYNNNIIIDLLLQKYKDNKDTTNTILLYIINNIPCYNLNKYIKLYNKTNNTKFKTNKQLSKLITSLWTYESFINKKNYNTFENEKLKLIKKKSVDKWLDYFNYLIENKDTIDTNYIINTFERFLQITPSYLKVWLLYIEFIKSGKTDRDVFVYYHRLNSVKTINVIYKTMDPSLKVYIKVFWMNEIKKWYRKMIQDDTLCRDAIPDLFKLIRNLKNNNDSLSPTELNILLTIYMNILFKHLSFKYKNSFSKIICIILNEFGYVTEHDAVIQKYLVSKNLINPFGKVTDESVNPNVFQNVSKFVIKTLISNKATTETKPVFNSSLKPFIYSLTPKTNDNQIITYKNIIEITKKYGTIDDYKHIIIHLNKLKNKQSKSTRKPKLKRTIRHK